MCERVRGIVANHHSSGASCLRQDVAEFVVSIMQVILWVARFYVLEQEMNSVLVLGEGYAGTASAPEAPRNRSLAAWNSSVG